MYKTGFVENTLTLTLDWYVKTLLGHNINNHKRVCSVVSMWLSHAKIKSWGALSRGDVKAEALELNLVLFTPKQLEFPAGLELKSHDCVTKCQCRHFRENYGRNKFDKSIVSRPRLKEDSVLQWLAPRKRMNFETTWRQRDLELLILKLSFSCSQIFRLSRS